MQLGFWLSFVLLAASWAIWSLLPPLRGGHLPPHHPKDHNSPELPWPDRKCRLQEDRSCGLWENLRWRPGRAGGNRREKGVACLSFHGLAGCAPTPQTCRPHPASVRVEGTRAHCSEAGSSPEGQGRGVKSNQPSLPLLGRLGTGAQKPPPPHTLARSASRGPFPLAAFPFA